MSLSLNDIMASIKEFKAEFCAKYDNILEKMEANEKNISKFLLKVDENIKMVQELERRLSRYENLHRRKNLILYNLPEKTNEKPWALEQEIQTIFSDVLQSDITLKDTDVIKRIGLVKGKRPIIIRFTSLRCKLELLRKAKNLKGSDLVLSEDFPVEIREIRKKLYSYWKEARNSNKKVYMKYDKLWVEGRLYSLEELRSKFGATSVCSSGSGSEEDSASTGIENLSDGTLRNWLKEGKLIKRRIFKKRKAEESPEKRHTFRRPQTSKPLSAKKKKGDKKMEERGSGKEDKVEEKEKSGGKCST
uniref:Endonuclease-reverse transcriptase n=1 Tax=Rhodnius prolixus TaxID=13249 RepID=T1HJV4_RHOPR